MTTENLVSVASICVHHVYGRISSSVSITTDERDLTAIRRPGRRVIQKIRVLGQAYQAAAVAVDRVDIGRKWSLTKVVGANDFSIREDEPCAVRRPLDPARTGTRLRA